MGNQALMSFSLRLPRLAGAVVLGGLFPIHEKSENTDQSYGEKLNNRGLQRMEAMLYAVDK